MNQTVYNDYNYIIYMYVLLEAPLYVMYRLRVYNSLVGNS